MGFRELAASMASKSFDIFNNIQQSCTYRSKMAVSPSYDPASGVTDPYTDIPVSMIFTSFRSNEIYNSVAGTVHEIRQTDMKGLIPSQRLPVTPKMNDIIVLNGVSWEVLRVKQDPAGALWTFHLRQP